MLILVILLRRNWFEFLMGQSNCDMMGQCLNSKESWHPGEGVICIEYLEQVIVDLGTCLWLLVACRSQTSLLSERAMQQRSSCLSGSRMWKRQHPRHKWPEGTS